MRKRKLIIKQCILLLAVLSVIILFCSTSTVPTAHQKRDIANIKTDIISYIALGDSLAKGYPYENDKNGHGYSYYIYDELCKLNNNKTNVSYKNYGVLGLTSSELLNMISQDNMKEDLGNADIITISIGGNDFISRLNINDLKDIGIVLKYTGDYLNNLSKIYTKLQEINPNARIYISNFYNPFSDEELSSNNIYFEYGLSYINKSLENQSFRYSVKVADLSGIFKGHEYKTDSPWIYDSIHPNDQGYKETAKVFINEIIKDYNVQSY